MLVRISARIAAAAIANVCAFFARKHALMRGHARRKHCTLDAVLAAHSECTCLKRLCGQDADSRRHVLNHEDACMACMRRYKFRMRGKLENNTAFEYKIKDDNGEAADTFFAFFVPAPAFSDVQAGTPPLNRCLSVEHDSMNQPSY